LVKVEEGNAKTFEFSISVTGRKYELKAGNEQDKKKNG